jgi:hypothetical protein
MIVVAALVATAGACVRYSTKFSSESAPRPQLERKPAEAVSVLTIPPGRSYVEIGRIEIVAVGVLSSYDRAIAEMRREAAAHGCDAIVTGAASLDGDGRQYAAACIVYDR